MSFVYCQIRGIGRVAWFALFTWGSVLGARADDSHLARLGVSGAHARGITGKGLTVAILDNGFRGYRAHLGKALPVSIETRSFRDDGNLEAKDSVHGLLCAEIVHAIAPEAKLLFANWEPDDPASFLRAVDWTRNRGARIISCSIVMPGWSDGLGGGDVHRELSKRLDDVLFFASAGNLAQRHWTGNFRSNGDEVHRWKVGRTENGVLPWGGQPVSVELVARDDSSYRLTVIDERNNAVAPARRLTGTGIRGQCIRFVPETGQRYRTVVERISGKGGEFRLIVLGGELEFSTPTGCMVFPGDSRNVIAVGAVSDRNERTPTSALGYVGRCVKPDCVALTPFPTRIRKEPFQGTSAAAPQAAGIAALLWSEELHANSSAIQARLLKACADIAAPGPDAESGFGMIRYRDYSE